MLIPAVTTPVHLVVGETTLEVGRMIVEHHVGADLADTTAPNAAVIALRGRLELDPEFVAFVQRYAPAQDAAPARVEQG